MTDEAKKHGAALRDHICGAGSTRSVIPLVYTFQGSHGPSIMVLSKALAE
jgi:hypothetical protein